MQPHATSYTLLTDFFHLGFTGFERSEEIGLVGSNSRGDLMIYTNYSQKSSTYKTLRIRNLEHSRGKLVNVISDNFGSGNISYLLVHKEDDTFHSTIRISDTEEIHLPDSYAAPMLVTNPADNKLLILLGIGNTIKFYSIEDNKAIQKQTMQIENKILHNRHTSGFVDLTGDLHANLALMVVENNKTYLEIYDFKTTTIRFIQRIELPNDIGPTLFIDTRNQQKFDLVFISIEKGQAYLNIYYNKNIPNLKRCVSGNIDNVFSGINSTEIFSEKFKRQIKLNDYLRGVPVLRDENDMPKGICNVDLEADGLNNLLINIKRDGTELIQGIILDKKDTIYSARYNSTLNGYSNARSVSPFDLEGNGKQALLLNYVDGTSPVLKILKLQKKFTNSMLRVLAINNSSPNPGEKPNNLPGVTYFIMFDNQTKFAKQSQSINTSYASLQPHGAFIGLGPTKFFVNYVLVKTNSSKAEIKRRKDATHEVVPNTFVIFSGDKGVWKVINLFNFSAYRKVEICLLLCLLVNLAALIAIAIKSYKDEKNSNRDNAVFGPLFAAL